MSDQPTNLIRLNNARLSFPHLTAPHASAPGAKPKYSASFLLQPNDLAYAQFLHTVYDMANAEWKEHAPAIMQAIEADRKLRSYGNGDEMKDKNFQPLDGYPGMVYIKANKDTCPDLFGADANPLMNAAELYGGCYVNAYVQPWLQNNEHGRAVRCEVVAIQFNAPGEPFGAAPIDTTGLFNPVAGAPAPVGQAPGVPTQGQPGLHTAAGVNPGMAPGTAPAYGAPPGAPLGQPAAGNPPAQGTPPVPAPPGQVAPPAPQYPEQPAPPGWPPGYPPQQ